MPKTIAQRELRNDNAKVIDAVAKGETFLVTRNGVLVAEIRPVRSRRPTLVGRAELAALATSGPDRRELVEDLDRVVDQRLA